LLVSSSVLSRGEERAFLRGEESGSERESRERERETETEARSGRGREREREREFLLNKREKCFDS
jgi:hypothetical protein